MKEKSREDKLKRYIEYSRENKKPIFIPYDGYCSYCGHDLIPDWDGVNVITGCRKCSKSYAD